MHYSEAEALIDCLICSMSRRDVLDLIGRYPVIALRITEVLSQRLRDAEERFGGDGISGRAGAAGIAAAAACR
jgi:CRP-like cAMP-binding protein